MFLQGDGSATAAGRLWGAQRAGAVEVEFPSKALSTGALWTEGQKRILTLSLTHYLRKC